MLLRFRTISKKHEVNLSRIIYGDGSLMIEHRFNGFLSVPESHSAISYKVLRHFFCRYLLHMNSNVVNMKD